MDSRKESDIRKVTMDILHIDAVMVCGLNRSLNAKDVSALVISERSGFQIYTM